MAQPDEGAESAQEIQQQFALLQSEMQRVMDGKPSPSGAAPPTDPMPSDSAMPADEAADFARIERGLEELRRDADRLRSRMTQAAETSAASEAIAALGARIDAVAQQTADLAKRGEENAARLMRFAQGNRASIEDLTVRLEVLGSRRSLRWVLALTILIGAVLIAAAVLLTVPANMKLLMDRIHAAGLLPGPAADAAASQPAAREAMTSLPPVPAAPVPTAAAPAPAPAPSPVDAAAPQPPPATATAAAPAANSPPPAPSLPATATPTPAPPVAAPASVAVPAAPPAAAPVPVVAASATPAPPAPPPLPPDRIVLQAKKDTWVEVRNRQGAALIARILRAGETWSVPDQPALVLSTGNAGGLVLLVNGQPAPALGAVGAVRRDVPLDPDLIRAGQYGAEPTAHRKQAAASP